MPIALAPIGRLRTGARISSRSESFVAGSAVTWLGEFRDPTTGALTAAEAVEFRFAAPDGVMLVMPAIEVSAGIYGATYVFPMPGLWLVRLVAEDARVDERGFVVRPSGTDLDAEAARPVATASGAILILPNGRAIGGV